MSKPATISGIIAEAIKRQGGNKAKIGRKIGVSSQLLGQYVKGPKEPKLAFYVAWKKEFREDLYREIETKVYNLGHENGLEKAIQAGKDVTITDVMSSLGTIQKGLNTVLYHQIRGRADVRAYGEYQVMKDARNNEGRRVEIMGLISKLIDENLTDGELMDMPT